MIRNPENVQKKIIAFCFFSSYLSLFYNFEPSLLIDSLVDKNSERINIFRKNISEQFFTLDMFYRN